MNWNEIRNIVIQIYIYKPLSLILYCPCFCSHYFLWYRCSLLSFWVEANLRSFFYCLFMYRNAIGDPVIKRGGFRSHFNWYNHAICLCLPQPRTWISNVICCSLFISSSVSEDELSWEVIVGFVDIVGIIDHPCLSFLLIIWSFSSNYKSYKYLKKIFQSNRKYNVAYCYCNGDVKPLSTIFQLRVYCNCQFYWRKIPE